MKTRNDAFISRGKSTVIALSAPIFNILLGTAMIFLGQSMFGYVNLVIGAWNILPIKGLDGSG
jgi:Zn-dependent protease